MNTPRILTTTIASFLLAPSLHAAERFWRDTSGTAFFNNTVNWSATSGGAGGASVPVAADTANFDLAGTYTVEFSLSPTNNNLEVEAGTVSFDLSNNTYTISDAVRIGVTAAATTARLTLFDGTLDVDTNGDDITIGAVDADGFLTVSTGGVVGAGGTNPDIRLGDGGDGTLTINNGGVVNSNAATFGLASNQSNGTATVTGLGSQWTNSGAFTVGSTGSGTLTVQNGATISGVNSFIGSSSASIGAATVSGTGSRWTESAGFSVGFGGVAGLTISSGGEMTVATDAFIATANGSFGTVNVTGLNSRWTIGGALIVANSGQGSLTISSGGEVAAATLRIGDSNGATTDGNVTITGAGSTLQVSGAADVGDDDLGSLTVSGGGSLVTLAGADLGNNPLGVGEITVTGANSQWTNTGAINVAALGTGTLNVSNGGTITTGNFTRALTAPLNWTDGTLHIANGTFNNASANLTINGADTADLPKLRLSGNSTGAGFGATTLTVGNTRSGALEITGIATLSVANVVTGTQDTGSGTITVGGSGAVLLASGSIGIGGTSSSAGGTGVLNISNGGTVSANSFHLWNRGTVNLDGGTLNTFTFGTDGGAFHFNSGTVHFTGGAAGGLDSIYDALLGQGHRLTAGQTIRYDLNFGFTDMDLIVEGGTLDVTPTLAVGSGSIIEVRSGNVSASTLTNDAAGQIVLAGGSVELGTTFTNPGDLRLAATSDFSLITGTTLTNTGLIHGNGRIGMALTNNSAGQVRVEDGERMVFTGASTNNGTGRIEVNAGGDLQFSSTLANSANIDVIGGTLRVEGAATNAASTGRITTRNAILRFNGGLANNGSLALSFGTSDIFGDITNSATGRIVVSGNSNATFYDDLVNNGAVQVSLGSTAVYFGAVSGTGSFPGAGTNFFEGDLAPGASPAIVEFGGDLVLGSAASLILEIGGLVSGAQHDHLNVGGALHADGDLVLALLDGFTPQLGDTFDLLDVGAFAGDFDSISAPALPGGNAWDFSALKNTGSVTVVPEPGIGALLASALGLLGFRRGKHPAAISRN